MIGCWGRANFANSLGCFPLSYSAFSIALKIDLALSSLHIRPLLGHMPPEANLSFSIHFLHTTNQMNLSA